MLRITVVRGQRAVELMLLSAASCLTFFLAEHVKASGAAVTSLRVACDGKIVSGPDRLGEITTRVTIEGTLSREDRKHILEVCDRQWKVMNSIRAPRSGRVARIFAENAAPVEYGEPLLVIE